MNDIFEYSNNFLKYKEVFSDCIIDSKVDDPIITILMPVYNRITFFEEALNSALNQSFKFPYEILIVDNNGNNNVIEDFYNYIINKKDTRISYYRNETNIGMFGNWNRCIELCKSELCVFLHDDDILEKDCLENLYSHYLEHDGKSIFACHSTVNDNGNLINKYIYEGRRKLQNISLFDIYLEKSISTGCGCLLVKNQLMEIGGFNEEYYPASDWVVNILLAHKYGTFFLRQSTAMFRVGRENTSSRVYQQYPEILYFYRNCLLKHINIPNFFLKYLNNILRQKDFFSVYNTWGDKTTKLDDINIFEKFILRIVYYISELKWRY